MASCCTRVVATLFLFMVLFQFEQTVVGINIVGSGKSPASSPTGAPINCDAECGRRCSATSRPNRCNRACMACCHTCNCVPPGTSGNKDQCPCYANLLNPKNGVHKCP